MYRRMPVVNWLLFALMAYSALHIYSQSTHFQLKCIVREHDNKKYCVRDRTRLNDAVELLATCINNLDELVAYCNQHHGSRPCVVRLVKNYDPSRIRETLPTSKLTAYSQNKGETIALCLNKNKSDEQELIDLNTLMFVAIHELAHISSKSIGHTPEYWQNFKFLLVRAKEIGVYTPVDYSDKPSHYCGQEITDNPYFDTLNK